MDLFFAGMDFALAAMNVYFGLTGIGTTALNWSAVVFCFGMGFVQIAIYVKKGR